jgi:CRP-like cAMP-binding protein
VDPTASDASIESDNVAAALENTTARVRRAFLRTVQAGQVLFDIGDPGEPLFVVQAGEVEVLEDSPGGSPRLLARLGPGDPVGEVDALLARPRSTRAVAVTDGRLLQLDRETFRSMCLERPEIALRIVQRLAQRAVDLERRLVALGMHDLVRPVARAVMLLLPERPQEGARLSTTLRTLAESVGLSMRDAQRGLGELFERKIVRLAEDALVVTDPSALVACVEDDAESTGSGHPAPRE